MKIYDLRTEYRKNPIGLDVKVPRFSWKMQADEKNTVQTSWHIVVKEDSVNGTVVWDSKTVPSASSVLIEYQGTSLKPETCYSLWVEVQDNHGNTACASAEFETGIFDTETFRAKMITHDFPEEETACPVFETAFSLKKQPKKACVYVTAHGVYEMQLNGKRVGDYRMTPGWTSYHHRLQYQIFDVTDLLAADNKLQITVGNGWYKGILGFTCEPDRYGKKVGAFAELHITYEDGSAEMIFTDESWSVRTGEIRSSEIYMGETIDSVSACARKGTVLIEEFDKKLLTAQENEPVRITERIPAKELILTPKGERVIDFGQNITGIVEVKVNGQKGQKITIRHAEVLDREGNFYPETLRQAKSVDTYICNGKEQVFLPHFTFHGFRYICVEGMEEPSLEQFTACVMHSDMEKTGEFKSSNKKVNQLQSNIAWGQRDNFLDIPTDCPQRDERLGWTGDAQIFSWTAAFNRNTALFFTKWMHDVAAESSLEKGVPHVVPDILEQYSASAWSDVAVIIPWVVYQIYGDRRILRENWKCMHENLYECTLEAFRQEYYTPTGRIVSETQTGAVLSLYFNLAREKDRKRIVNTLLTNIENHKNHLSTGFVGTPYICHALSENGAHDMAATLFMKEDYPSWLYAVNMGATTVWERWDSIKPDGTFDESGMNSLNHYAYGSIGDWMYRKVAGLSQLEPGYKKFLVKPMFVKGIEEAGVQFESVYGKIDIHTSCKNGKIQVHIEIPPNTAAVICLPEKEEAFEVGSGVYDYEYETATSLSYDRFSMDSTLGEILEQPLALEMFNQMVPGMLDNPMIQFAYQMTLSELLGAAPEARPLYEAVVNALNVKEKSEE